MNNFNRIARNFQYSHVTASAHRQNELTPVWNERPMWNGPEWALEPRTSRFCMIFAANEKKTIIACENKRIEQTMEHYILRLTSLIFAWAQRKISRIEWCSSLNITTRRMGLYAVMLIVKYTECSRNAVKNLRTYIRFTRRHFLLLYLRAFDHIIALNCKLVISN